MASCWREGAARARGSLAAIAATVVMFGSIGPAMGEDRVWVTGRVVDSSGKPLAGAFVAAYNENHAIVDYSKTDVKGEYALAVPRAVLHLDPKRGPDMFTRVTSSITRFVGGQVTGAANAVRTTVRALTATEAVAASANPAARATAAQGAAQADRAVTALTTRKHRHAAKKDPNDDAAKQPGALLIKAVAPDCCDLVGVTHTYWIEQEVPKNGDMARSNLAAWMDPVQLMPAAGGKPSVVQPIALKITTAKIEPSLVQRGQKVHITAAMPAPADPPVYVVLIARDSRSGDIWELKPAGKDQYAGDFVVDPKMPVNDQVISVLAYAAQSEQAGRRPEIEKAIEKAGLWDLKKPFQYNPLLVVSSNRVDLTLSIVPDRPAH